MHSHNTHIVALCTYHSQLLLGVKQIRFIAITNGVDSTNPDSLEFVPFLNIFQSGSPGMPLGIKDVH